MAVFRWLGAGALPASCDLRQCGWRLAAEGAAAPALPVALARPLPGTTERHWPPPPAGAHPPGAVLLIGVACSTARASLLRAGFGDVLGEDPALAEIETRAHRLALQSAALPRERHVGPLRLDLFARDGWAGGRRLGLHPREFALLWRLAEAPGVAVAKPALLRDVWHSAHVPETNSLAVHVFRLRRKLALAGCPQLLRTSAGGYCLEGPDAG